ncbi:MAG: M23 family metallopeptidase [Verrucomicrobiota bacterium]
MIARAAAFLLALAFPLHAALFDWPTENRALLEGRPQDFYMYVNRSFEGVESKPWEGGTFGFVRGPQRQSGEVVYTSLHEGIDIAPVRRDPAGNPLDDILASAAGKVVHTSRVPGASNYGRYIVIEHTIEGSRVYTLYAHLSQISVETGQHVEQGERIGRMGFSGDGIDQERSHLHFEIAVLLSEHFEAWHQRHFAGSPNKHGLFNGLNLAGIDPAPILLESAKNPAFSLGKHIRERDAFFKITMPADSAIPLIRRHPWLVPDGEPASPPAWTVAFTPYGFPVEARASLEATDAPKISWIAETHFAYHHATRGLVGGAPGAARLSDSGKRFVQLLGGL